MKKEEWEIEKEDMQDLEILLAAVSRLGKEEEYIEALLIVYFAGSLKNASDNEKNEHVKKSINDLEEIAKKVLKREIERREEKWKYEKESMKSG